MTNNAKLELLQHMITTHLIRTIRANSGLCYGVDIDYIQYRNYTIINLILIFDTSRYKEGMKVLLEEIEKPFSLELFQESVNFLKYNIMLKKNTSLTLAQYYVDQASCFSEHKVTLAHMLLSLDNINFEQINNFKNTIINKSSASYITT